MRPPPKRTNHQTEEFEDPAREGFELARKGRTQQPCLPIRDTAGKTEIQYMRRTFEHERFEKARKVIRNKVCMERGPLDAT